MIKVLFVCTGNICRSPMADAVFQHMVNLAGLEDKIMVDSAGTGSWHVGESAHRGTQRILRKYNIPYQGRARQINRYDLNDFDYILTMDKSNMRNLMRIDADPKKTHMFLSFALDADMVDVEEVPDPYYNDRFDLVYDLVNKGCEALLDHIRKQHKL